MEVKINMDRLNAAIAKAQPKYEEQFAPKQQATAQSLGLTIAPAAGGIETVVMTFCAAWPKVYPVLNLGLKFAGWFLPAATVGLARSVVEGINTELYPQMCPKA